MLVLRTIPRLLIPRNTSRLMSLLTYTPYRSALPDKLEVKLTDVEDQICTLVDECAAHLKEKNIETTCRIAGGWVRDKLLGSESNDIDIALSDMMGAAFAEHFVAFAHQKGITTSDVAKIALNPEQSKHLETATFRVLNRSIDVVNLRSEEYTGDSRIPNQITFGTPLQDALRRDITINALFYNIHTRAVEDFTEKALKGLDDLRSGIVRTPLPPRETFLDDPLRVIRCIRFSTRFDFALAPELADATKDPVIQAALRTKVSRERVGEELTKMVKGPNPRRSIQTIHDLSLYSSIFSVLPKEITLSFSRPVADDSVGIKAAAILDTLLTPSALTSSRPLPPIHATLSSQVHSDPTCKARLFLAAALTPYRLVTYLDKKKKAHPVIEAVIRESLKLGAQNHFLDGIPLLFDAVDVLRTPRLSDDRFQGTNTRVAIGLLLREKSVHNPLTGSHWTSSLLFSLVQELTPLYDYEKDFLSVEKASQIINEYNLFVERALEHGLQDAVDARPLLDGREVSLALGASKPGPWLGRVLSQVVEWQLGHPEGAKEDCIAWLKREKDEGRILIDAAPIAKKPKTK